MATERTQEFITRHSQLIEWLGLADGESGDVAEVPSFPDMTLQLDGTFGAGGEMTFEGSNDGTNFFILTEIAGTTIVLTGADLATIVENPRFIRPRISAGSGVALNIRVLAHNANGA